MSAEMFGEQTLAHCGRLGMTHRLEAECLPCGMGAFDDERGGVRVELICIRPYQAMFGLLEDERDGLVELLAGAEPLELAGAELDLRAEVLLVGTAGSRIQAVGSDNKIVLPGERGQIVDLRLEVNTNAELRGPFQQKLEEAVASDTAETVAGRDDAHPPHAGRKILPVHEVTLDGGRGHRVVGSEEIQRPVG